MTNNLNPQSGKIYDKEGNIAYTVDISREITGLCGNQIVLNATDSYVADTDKIYGIQIIEDAQIDSLVSSTLKDKNNSPITSIALVAGTYSFLATSLTLTSGKAILFVKE